MDIPVKAWYEAIYTRRSRRKYIPDPISTEALNQLTHTIQNLNSEPFLEGARAVMVNQNPDDVFKGALGSYGKIKDAPAYIAFVGDTQNPFVQEKVGYLGESVILEATALGLGTCWVAGFFNPSVVAQQIKVLPHERVLAVTPLGRVSDQFNFEEKIMSGFTKPNTHKRKTLPSMCEGESRDHWSEWVRCSLEAARLAPSAVNRQPWRFFVEPKSITVSVDSLKDTYHCSKRLDCGIATLHVDIGARYAGKQGRWEFLSGTQVARFMVE